MNKFPQLISLLFFLLFGVQSLAAPSFMVVEGQLIDPSGHVPVEGSNVDFVLEVLSPGPEECVLYEEAHTLNMSNSNGFFALDLGEGVRSGANFEDTSTIESAFSNSTGAVTPTTCAAGPTYTPSARDHRKLRITFDDGGGPITLGQDVLIGANAYAMSAGSVGGLSASELLQINIGAGFNLNQSNLEYVFNDTNWTELQALLDGSSASFSGGGGEVNTASNLGAGDGLFAQKTGTDLEFRSLSSGDTKLGIASTANEITLTVDESNFDPTLIPIGTTPLTATTLQNAIVEMDANKIPNSRSIIAGNGLTGGGDLTLDRSIDIGAGPGILVNANDISVQAGNGIAVDGGGVHVDFSSTTSETTIDALDDLLIYDNSAGDLRRMPRNNFVRSASEIHGIINGFNSFVSHDGNTFTSPLTLGTNDNYGLNFETNNTTAMTITNIGYVGVGTKAPSAQFEILQGPTTPTQLVRVVNDISQEVFSVDHQGRTLSSGAIHFGDNGASCVATNDIGQMRTSAALNAIQVCVDINGTRAWANLNHKYCPSGMTTVGANPQNPDICISSTPSTGSHDSAAATCHTNYPGSKLCSQRQMAQANAIASMTFTTNAPHIVSDLVYDGGYRAALVNGSGTPDGIPVALAATGQSFHCCID